MAQTIDLLDPTLGLPINSVLHGMYRDEKVVASYLPNGYVMLTEVGPHSRITSFIGNRKADSAARRDEQVLIDRLESLEPPPSWYHRG